MGAMIGSHDLCERGVVRLTNSCERAISPLADVARGGVRAMSRSCERARVKEPLVQTQSALECDALAGILE